jgi:hypothetical protein
MKVTKEFHIESAGIPHNSEQPNNSKTVPKTRIHENNTAPSEIISSHLMSLAKRKTICMAR